MTIRAGKPAGLTAGHATLAAILFAVALGGCGNSAVGSPTASSAESAAAGSASMAAPTSAPTAAPSGCPLPTDAATATPGPTAVPSLRKPDATPDGWPVSLANMDSPGNLADDGTSYFIEGGYLVAVDSSGREKAGWPQPLGIRTDHIGLAFGSEGTVYVWDDSTVVAYRADGTRPAGWPYHTAAVEDVLPVPQGVYVESMTSGSAMCGDVSHVMTLIGPAGAVQSTWRLQGDIVAVGPDGTLYTRQGDSILAYGSDGALKPGWPATGWSYVSLDPSGRVYLSWWKFMATSGISMEGPGLALETRIAAVDQNGRPYPGWPVTIEGGASEPAFGPDGTVYMTREVRTSGSVSDSVLALDATGKPKPGWPLVMPAGDELLGRGSIGRAAPDPPQVGSNGTVYFGAGRADPSNPGILEEVDPSGRPKPGFPTSLDWGSTSNLFSGPGSGWFAVGRTGLVFTTDDYSVLAIGPDGKTASGWPVKAPAHTIIMGADLEPDGGLLVQALESSLVMHPPAVADHKGSRTMGDALAALAPDFPGTLMVIRYLPDGTVAP